MIITMHQVFTCTYSVDDENGATKNLEDVRTGKVQPIHKRLVGPDARKYVTVLSGNAVLESQEETWTYEWSRESQEFQWRQLEGRYVKHT